MSEKAWKFYERSNLPKFYLDMAAYKKNVGKNTTPYTPAVTLVIGLAAVLRQFEAQGMENIYKNAAALAEASREGLMAIGLEMFAKKSPTPALTAALTPPEINANKVISGLKIQYGMTVAGGQDQAKGKIFRISHMGYINKADIVAVISAIESVLRELGHKFDFGAGTTRAAEVLSEA